MSLSISSGSDSNTTSVFVKTMFILHDISPVWVRALFSSGLTFKYHLSPVLTCWKNVKKNLLLVLPSLAGTVYLTAFVLFDPKSKLSSLAKFVSASIHCSKAFLTGVSVVVYESCTVYFLLKINLLSDPLSW